MLSLAALLTCSVGCSDGITRNVLGEVLQTEGSAQLEADGTTPRELHARDPIAAGSTVRTAGASTLAIALIPNALVLLRESTALRIVRLSLTKDGDETGDAMRRRVAHVRLLQGSILFSHERRDVAAEPTLTIDTADGVLTTSYDCDFSVTLDANGTRVICAAGLLYFQRADQSAAVEVPAGSSGEWSRNRQQVSRAESNETSQSVRTEMLEAATRLRALRTARRDEFPD